MSLIDRSIMIDHCIEIIPCLLIVNVLWKGSVLFHVQAVEREVYILVDFHLVHSIELESLQLDDEDGRELLDLASHFMVSLFLAVRASHEVIIISFHLFYFRELVKAFREIDLFLVILFLIDVVLVVSNSLSIWVLVSIEDCFVPVYCNKGV
jgi:hypothetical protein